MQLFINECSLESQYSDLALFRAALTAILGLAKAAQADFEECRNYYAQDHLYALEYTAVFNEPFMTTFHQIKDNGFKTRVQQIPYQELRVKDWRSEQVHDSQICYECLSDLCSGTSLAEAAERVLQNASDSIMLLNFTPSKYDGISVLKVAKRVNGGHKIAVDCSHTISMVASWLQKLKQRVPTYDITSTETPRDEQTILTDITRFKLTPYRIQGRKVYEKQTTNYKMYVDNLHHGAAAHIEVFSKSNHHIGEASLDGIIDVSKAKPGREFNPNS